MAVRRAANRDRQGADGNAAIDISRTGRLAAHREIHWGTRSQTNLYLQRIGSQRDSFRNLIVHLDHTDEARRNARKLYGSRQFANGYRKPTLWLWKIRNSGALIRRAACGHLRSHGSGSRQKQSNDLAPRSGRIRRWCGVRR